MPLADLESSLQRFGFDRYLGRTSATLEVPEGPHRALGAAVYFGTALAEPGDTELVCIELWEAPV